VKKEQGEEGGQSFSERTGRQRASKVGEPEDRGVRNCGSRVRQGGRDGATEQQKKGLGDKPRLNKPRAHKKKRREVSKMKCHLGARFREAVSKVARNLRKGGTAWSWNWWKWSSQGGENKDQTVEKAKGGKAKKIC